MISENLANELKCYFKGKLATVITQPMSMSLNAKSLPKWFTLQIDDIDRECIAGTDMQRRTKSVFFFGPQLIGIAEEQVVPPDHPDYESIKEKMKQMQQSNEEQNDNKPEITSSPISKMAKEAEIIKNKWSTSDKER